MLSFYALMFLNNKQVQTVREAGFTCLPVSNEVTGYSTRHYRVWLATGVKHIADYEPEVTLNVIAAALGWSHITHTGSTENKPCEFLVTFSR